MLDLKECVNDDDYLDIRYRVLSEHEIAQLIQSLLN